LWMSQPEGELLKCESRIIGVKQTDVGQIAVTSDEKVIAAASLNSIALLRRTDGEILGRINAHTELVQHLAFLPDDKQLISASADGDIRATNVLSGNK